MIKIYSKLLSISHYLPKDILTNDDLSTMVDTNDEWIVKRTGIKERHINNDMTTAEMASISAKEALAKAKLQSLEIDVIIGATVTADHRTPSMACVVQDLIGATNAYAFDISAACSGMIYAMDIGDSLIKAGKAKNILVVCAETLSRIIDYTDRNTCVLFGDGAASVVLTADEEHGILQTHLSSDGTGGKHLYAQSLPCESIYNRKDVGRYYMHMTGAEILKFTTRVVPTAIDQVLEKSGLTIEDIDYIIPHQANIRIIENIVKKYNVPIEKIGINLQHVGNTSSCSIGICMSEMLDAGKIKRGDRLLLVGFGAGLTYGAIILDF